MSEEDLADFIRDRMWVRLLEERWQGPGVELDETTNLQDRSRSRAAAVIGVIEQRQHLLEDLYPFALTGGRRLQQVNEGAAYLWHLYISMAHGLQINGVPTPTMEFERSVAARLEAAGIPAASVGTAVGMPSFGEKVDALARNFRGLVPTLDDVIISQFQKDGGIDTFGMFRCGADRRAAQWAFIGQSTVGRSDDWHRKIHEPKPKFWSKVFGERLLPMPFFATPHHIAEPYFSKLAQDYEDRCLLNRVRLTYWTRGVPDSFVDYRDALLNLQLE